MKLVIAGDVGGTSTRLLATRVHADGSTHDAHSQVFASGGYASLELICQLFLAQLRRRDEDAPVAAAAFGVAGPVVDGRSRLTNLSWTIDPEGLRAALGCPRARVLNDFHCVALAAPTLPADSLAVLQRGADPQRAEHYAVIGAGTGLGQAIGVPVDAASRVLATEGGHADFAPAGELEDELLRFMRGRHGHVSWERLVSGPGIVALHDFVVARELAPSSSETADALARAEDPAAEISARALAEPADPACARALELFLGLYGAEAGNLALKCLPGRLYIAGGIAPKLLPRLRAGEFMRRFLAKGRMRSVLEDIFVAVVLDPRVGLLGARAAALALT